MPPALRDAASSLKSLWVSIEMQATDAQQQQEMLKRILLLLVENIGELLDDDTWLRGQLDMVQEVIAGPLKIHSLQEAEKRLKEVIYKQSMVKHGLREATATLKATMTTFVSRMSDAVAANDEYQGKIATHIERISKHRGRAGTEPHPRNPAGGNPRRAGGQAGVRTTSWCRNATPPCRPKTASCSWKPSSPR